MHDFLYLAVTIVLCAIVGALFSKLKENRSKIGHPIFIENLKPGNYKRLGELCNSASSPHDLALVEPMTDPSPQSAARVLMEPMKRIWAVHGLKIPDHFSVLWEECGDRPLVIILPITPVPAECLACSGGSEERKKK